MPIGKTDDFQQLRRTLFGLSRGDPAQLHGEADVFQAGALHQQVEALENHGDVPASQPQFLFTDGDQLFSVAVWFHPGKLLAVNSDGTGSGTLQQVHTSDQRTLAGAGETNDTENLPLLDVQIDVFQSVDSTFAVAKGLV